MENETKNVTQETTKEAENPEQRLIAAFKAAMVQILGKDPGNVYQFETQGRWILLNVYLSGSEKRRFFKKPNIVRRGILASYLNTPFKVKEEPHALAAHWFRVVALLQPSTDASEGARVKSFLQQC